MQENFISWFYSKYNVNDDNFFFDVEHKKEKEKSCDLVKLSKNKNNYWKDTVLMSLWPTLALLVFHQEATWGQDNQSSSQEIQQMQLTLGTPFDQNVWGNQACGWTWVLLGSGACNLDHSH